ncbi:oligosaccharide flippase family protein [Candidatus Nomurabacteria bacterium]|nr:MAG: oligosaccharide flippase family protein [Candidatus Nomurabacteria bacterium]
MIFFKKIYLSGINKIENKINLHLTTFVKQGTWYFISHVANIIFAFSTSYLFAHYISKEEYGIYKYILSLSGILGAFTLTGMNISITRAVANGKLNSYIPSIKYQLRWNSYLFIISTIPIVYWMISGNFKIALGFGFISLSTILLTTFNTYNAYLSGKKEFKLIARYNIISSIFQTVSICSAIFLFKNALSIIIFSFSAQTLSAIFFYVKTKPDVKNVPSTTYSKDETIQFGKKLSLNNIIKLISDQSDKFIMFNLFGPYQLAIYAFAQALPDQIRGLFKIIPSVILPHLSERADQDIPKTFWKYLGVLFLLVTSMVIIYNIFAYFIFALFFSTYIDSVFYSRILSISMIPATLTLPLITLLNAQGKAGVSRTLSTTSAFTEIITLYVSGYFFGFIGMVIGKAISATIIFIIALFLVNKNYSIDPLTKIKLLKRM